MNAALEQGLRAYLAEKLSATEQTLGAGDEAVTALAFVLQEGGPLTTLHCNVAGDDLPADRSWCIIGVPQVTQVASGLHNAPVIFAISTPVKITGYDEAHHRALIAAVRACFPDMPRLHAARANASTPEEVTATQAALDGGLAAVALLAAKLAASAQVTISATSPWFLGGGKDGADGKLNRWQAFLDLKLSVQERRRFDTPPPPCRRRITSFSG